MRYRDNIVIGSHHVEISLMNNQDSFQHYRGPGTSNHPLLDDFCFIGDFDMPRINGPDWDMVEFLFLGNENTMTIDFKVDGVENILTGECGVLCRQIFRSIDKMIEPEMPVNLVFGSKHGQPSRIKLYRRFQHILAMKYGMSEYEMNCKESVYFILYSSRITNFADINIGPINR